MHIDTAEAPQSLPSGGGGNSLEPMTVAAWAWGVKERDVGRRENSAVQLMGSGLQGEASLETNFGAGVFKMGGEGSSCSYSQLCKEGAREGWRLGEHLRLGWKLEISWSFSVTCPGSLLGVGEEVCLGLAS